MGRSKAEEGARLVLLKRSEGERPCNTPRPVELKQQLALALIQDIDHAPRPRSSEPGRKGAAVLRHHERHPRVVKAEQHVLCEIPRDALQRWGASDRTPSKLDGELPDHDGSLALSASRAEDPVDCGVDPVCLLDLLARALEDHAS